MAKMLLVETHEGPTPHDGRWLVEYDPDQMGTDEWGRPMICHLVSTDDPREALELPPVEMMALWRKDSTTLAPRADGRPQRPLTAFTVEIVS